MYLEIGLNTWSVSLNERILLDAPEILLRVTSSGDRETSKVMLLNDISDPNDRLNKVEITLTDVEGNEDLANGIIFLLPGEYYYEFFESSDTNLNVDGKNRIQRGLLRYETATDSKDYMTQTTTKQYFQE